MMMFMMRLRVVASRYNTTSRLVSRSSSSSISRRSRTFSSKTSSKQQQQQQQQQQQPSSSLATSRLDRFIARCEQLLSNPKEVAWLKSQRDSMTPEQQSALNAALIRGETAQDAVKFALSSEQEQGAFVEKTWLQQDRAEREVWQNAMARMENPDASISGLPYFDALDKALTDEAAKVKTPAPSSSSSSSSSKGATIFQNNEFDSELARVQALMEKEQRTELTLEESSRLVKLMNDVSEDTTSNSSSSNTRQHERPAYPQGLEADITAMEKELANDLEQGKFKASRMLKLWTLSKRMERKGVVPSKLASTDAHPTLSEPDEPYVGGAFPSPKEYIQRKLDGYWDPSGSGRIRYGPKQDEQVHRVITTPNLESGFFYHKLDASLDRPYDVVNQNMVAWSVVAGSAVVWLTYHFVFASPHDVDGETYPELANEVFQYREGTAALKPLTDAEQKALDDYAALKYVPRLPTIASGDADEE